MAPLWNTEVLSFKVTFNFQHKQMFLNTLSFLLFHLSFVWKGNSILYRIFVLSVSASPFTLKAEHELNPEIREQVTVNPKPVSNSPAAGIHPGFQTQDIQHLCFSMNCGILPELRPLAVFWEKHFRFSRVRKGVGWGIPQGRLSIKESQEKSDCKTDVVGIFLWKRKMFEPQQYPDSAVQSQAIWLWVLLGEQESALQRAEGEKWCNSEVVLSHTQNSFYGGRASSRQWHPH